jgi:hypothetical protein
MWFGILQLATLVAGWVGGFLIAGVAFGGVTGLNLGPNPTPSQVSAALGPLFRNLLVLVPLVALVQIASVVILFMGFRNLKRADPRFSVPSTLTALLLVGGVVVISGAALLLSDLPNLISQVPSIQGSAITPGLATAIAGVIGYFVLIVIGGLLALVGLIGGQILGLWRAGSKYNETLLKLGAIFAIIPLLNIVAPILVIVGANQAKNRLPTG